MFNSAFLDVVIGLFFIFLVLSSAASSITEVIASTFELRAKDLEKAIEQLLGNEANRDALFNSGIVAAATTFRAGLLQRFLCKTGLSLNKLSKYKLSGIAAKDFANAALEMIYSTGANTPVTENELRNLEKTGDRNPVEKWILNELKNPAADFNSVKLRIMEQFDSEMARLTKQYKKNIQLILFIVSLALCAAINADVFMMKDVLYRSNGLRQAIVASASNPGLTKSILDHAAITTPGAPPSPEILIKEYEKSMAMIPFPLGWSQRQLDYLKRGDAGIPNPRGWKNCFTRSVNTFKRGWMKLIGIIITAAACSMGAPFWYDMLQAALRLRSGKAPDTRPGEKPAPAETAPAPPPGNAGAK